MLLATEFTKIVRGYGLAEVYAFGSRAKETAARLQNESVSVTASKSDVDIAVRTQPGKTLTPSERVRLGLELEDLLGVSRIDLVIITEADAFLAAEIIRGELLYAEDPDQQARYELYVLRRAADLFPFKKERVRMILEEGAR
jgi:predicted nucleotidyltransferase